MNKLLLLVVSLINISTLSFAAPQHSGDTLSTIPLNDTTVKLQITGNPKEGFKDLFVKSAATSSFATSKLNPQAVSFVQDYMVSQSGNLMKMKNWGKPYFDLMNDVLARYGLPTELKYLAVIESNLYSGAVSWAGAVGPWQFMPETARQMGLRVSRSADERTDYRKSTHAAARYLAQLYNLYHDWLLVIAAYNGGPGNVNAAIRKSGSRNFWNLQYHLPTESRNHVKKFIATHYIMEGGGGATTLTKSERESLAISEVTAVPETADVSAQNISGKYKAAVIAQVVQISPAEFNRLNPNFDKQLASSGTYQLRLPEDKMLLFQANKPQILEQSIRLMLSL